MDAQWPVWECDGCGKTGTVEEIEAHITEVNTLADGSMKEVADIVCWGAMAVGGEAWKAYHEKGVHPMATLTKEISDRYFEFLEEVEGLKEGCE